MTEFEAIQKKKEEYSNVLLHMDNEISKIDIKTQETNALLLQLENDKIKMLDDRKRVLGALSVLVEVTNILVENKL